MRNRFTGTAELLGEEWFIALQTGDGPGALAAAEQYAAVAAPDDDSPDWRLATAQLAAGRETEARALLSRLIARYKAEADKMPRGTSLQVITRGSPSGTL